MNTLYKIYKMLKTKAAADTSVKLLFDLVFADCICVTGKNSYTYSNAAMQKSTSKYYK